MRCRIALLLLVLLPGALVAQAAVPQVSILQRWVIPPAKTSPGEYRLGPPRAATPPPSPFEFDDHSPRGPVGNPPPRAADRNVVLGLGQPWTDGRPPLDCAQTPMDAKCH